MLTEQERKEGFILEYAELEKKWGITLQFTLEPENYGSMIQVKLIHNFALLEGWIPPEIQEIDITDAFAE